MTLPDQPDLRHSPLFVQVPPLFEGNSFPSRGRPRQGTTQYITQFRHVNRSTLARRGVKRQQTLRRSGTVISTPDMANPRPFLPSLSLLHASLLSCIPFKIFYHISHMNSLFFTALDVERFLKMRRNLLLGVNGEDKIFFFLS